MKSTVSTRARAYVVAVAICISAWPGFAQSQTNRSKPFSPDACGPADPSYIRTANETGGIPMFLQRSEAAKAFQLVRESTRNNVATVFWATGTLDGKAKTVRIPVDSVTERITFTLSVDTKGSAAQIVPPSGTAIQDGTPNAEVTNLNCGRIVTMASPEAGEWRAEITGTGRYWLQVQAQSDVYFLKAEFVKEGGRPGHEGLFRIQGQPLAGAPAMLQVSLSAKATESADIYTVSEDGQLLRKMPMHAVNSEREFLELVGTVELPSVPFRIAVKGRDSNGKQYQRFYSSLFHAESVSVSPRLDFEELAPGSTMQAVYTVRNLDARRTYKITVTDAHRFVSGVEPKQLVLGAGESGTVRVDLTVPGGTTVGIGDDIVFVATSVEGPPTSNSSVVHLTVSSPATEKPH